MNNFINEKYIIINNLIENVIKISERPTGFMLCLSHVNAIFQSFFQKFLIGLPRIWSHAKVRNLVFIMVVLARRN